MDTGNIIFASGGYDHSIKFWSPHDGVCYRTAQHPESVRHVYIMSLYSKSCPNQLGHLLINFFWSLVLALMSICFNLLKPKHDSMQDLQMTYN